MAGPYPPHYGAGPVGPPPPHPGPPQPYPRYSRCATRLSGHASAADPVSEAQQMARRAGCAAGDRGGGRRCGRDRSGDALRRRIRQPETLTTAAAQTAIQDYLDALQRGDVEEIARHTLCGLFDAVKEKRSDLALADLSSDAFRKQFGKAEVTSVDKMVFSSPYQAQVLFTMRVTPAGSRTQPPPERAGTGCGSATGPGRPGPGVFVPAARGRPVLDQLNESPHAHEPVALGLSIVKPCFSMVSTKSIVAPWM